MGLEIPLACGAVLQIVPGPAGRSAYPTRRLQKGLLLLHGGQDLAEEGVGFGVPLLKCGLKTIFPGGVELSAARQDAAYEIEAVFQLNLQEKIARRDGDSLQAELVYAAKNALAALIRAAPNLRRPLTAASSLMRALFGWETTYEMAGFSIPVRLRYTIDAQAGSIQVQCSAPGAAAAGTSELVVMNEQGAQAFDAYEDTDGLRLNADQIGCWDLVAARQASFESTTHRLSFSLAQVEGARLFRGRERVGARLSWAGFGYSLPAESGEFGYTLKVEKIA